MTSLWIASTYITSAMRGPISVTNTSDIETHTNQNPRNLLQWLSDHHINSPNLLLVIWCKTMLKLHVNISIFVLKCLNKLLHVSLAVYYAIKHETSTNLAFTAHPGDQTKNHDKSRELVRHLWSLLTADNESSSLSILSTRESRV